MEFTKMQNYWVEKDKAGKHLPEDELKNRVKAFISSHKTLALATGTGSYVRNTPVEYSFDGKYLWIMSEGGKKFIGLEKNDQVSATIFETYQGFGTIHSVQIQGRALIEEPFGPVYMNYLQQKHIPEEMIRKMPVPMSLIRIEPVEIDYLDSGLKKEGFDVRQHLIV